jgi:transposase
MINAARTPTNPECGPNAAVRKLRRYRRRWMVEQTFAWLGHCRRLVVRYDRLITTDAGFFPLACALLTLGRVLK